MKISIRTLLGLLLALVAVTAIASLASAAPLLQDNNPIVIINKPPSNSTYSPGDIISVESVSASPVGIVQVDLLVDGQVYSSDQTPGTLPQVQFTLIQRWLANLPGTHVITVRATDSENRTGQASINVTVQAANTPTPLPTSVPPPTPTPFTCVLDSKFVRDVTIPDNTQLAPGSTFVKTWTLQNDGTCAWDAATVAVFVGGSQMAGGSPSPVGAVQPGQNFNLSVNFVAPGTPGTYRSSWKIQSGDGTQFGETFYVKIVVPGAPTPTPIPPPPTPPPPQPTGCQGAPQISFFTVDNSNLQRGQSTTLRWGLVGNADSVFLESPDGSGGVATPGQAGIQPHQTSTYTLAAYCKGFRVQQQVTVNVHGGGGNGGGAQGSIDGMDVGNQGNGRWLVRVYYSWNGAGGPAQVCASAQNSSSYPCTNARPDAPYAVLNLQGKNIGKVTACLIDRGGREVACGSN
ncbi:MAG: hypothetical protein HY741_16085 [Chloroflexi bacterium]|nr:hypothetical protein [Chloroflexota bacterium]